VAGDEIEPSENEQQLRFAANAVPALLSYVDRDGRYMWVNESYRRWFGYSPDEVRGRHIRDVLGEPAWVLLKPYMERALAGEEVTFESRLAYKNGPVRHVRATYTPHRDSSGRVRGFVVLSNDITAIKAAEEALRESERMLERSQSTAHVGSFEVMVGGESAGAVKWSDETYRMFGYAPREIAITHESFFDHIHPDDRARMRANSGPKIQRGLPFENVFRIVRPDGTIRVVHTWTDFERDAGGKGIRMVGTCQDVTEVRTAEAALRKSEQMLERSQSTAHVGSFEVEITDPNDLYAGSVRWSDETYRMFGYEPGAKELTGGTFYEHVHPDDRKKMQNTGAAHAKEGQPYENQYRIVRPDGTVRLIHTWIDFSRDADGKPVRMVGTCQDITEVRAAEAALRKSEHMLERSQSSAHVGSWEMNLADGEHGRAGAIHWSAETFRLMGLEPGSVAVSDRGFMDYIHPDDFQPICDEWTACIARGEPFESDFRIVRPDGTIRWIHTWTDFERDGEGKPTRLVGTCQDITEIKRAAQDLRDADRRKDEFLAMLSHELRNPLAPILSSIEIIERAGPGDDVLRASYQGIIARQVQHMKRLLDDLLDVSRVSQGKVQLRKESVNLSALLLQAVEVSRPMMLEKRQQLAMTLGQEWLPLDADPTRIIQVFANLLNNASRYTHPGGHIRLTSTVDNGEVVVSVRDDGMGMNADLLARAFELFVQEARSSDRAQGGLGIGLTLVRTLVKMHGGSVQAFSDGPGCGSEFVVRLPLAAVANLPTARPAPAPIEVDTRGALRVLVVDDNEDAANALGQVLELSGHQVTLAHDGPGAIAAAAAAPPELVLLDIGLPGMDGYAVAERLRAAGHDRAALVAISGYGQDDDVRRSSEAGFDHHLVKPVDGAVLRKLIAEVSGRLARPADAE